MPSQKKKKKKNRRKKLIGTGYNRSLRTFGAWPLIIGTRMDTIDA